MHLIESYALNSGAKIDKPYIHDKFFPLSFENDFIVIQPSSELKSKRYKYWNEVLDLLIPKLNEKDMNAFRIMGLEFTASWPIIQKKFKTLVKKFHPDKNAGNKQFEDKLKTITMAYSHLKLTMIRSNNYDKFK